MYRGFNLTLERADDIANYRSFAGNGRTLLQERWPSIPKSLSSVAAGDKLDGDAIMHNWFRQVDADVFLSHSHADEDLALGLAWEIEHKLGLRVFVDSMVWRNCDDLLREFDNDYCYDDDRKTYIYERRNYSTSHMHMMLAASIGHIIDRTECIIFLNTPSSVQMSDAKHLGVERVASPWIYHELTLTRLLRRRVPKRRQQLRESLEHLAGHPLASALPDVTYKAPLEHLAPINDLDIAVWTIVGDVDDLKGKKALDHLYEMHDAPLPPTGDEPVDEETSADQ